MILNSDIVLEAVFLNPKAYYLKTMQAIKQKAQGVRKDVKQTPHNENHGCALIQITSEKTISS